MEKTESADLKTVDICLNPKCGYFSSGMYDTDFCPFCEECVGKGRTDIPHAVNMLKDDFAGMGTFPQLLHDGQTL